MRIDLNGRTPEVQQNQDLERARSTAARPSPDSAEAPPQDTARLSSLSHALATQAMQTPEVRQAKVAALARAIRDGSYNVGSEQVADSLFSEMAAKSGRWR